MNKICGIYKITNTVTGDCYIGSSKDVKCRWASHKWPSTWKKYPNKQLYKDMKEYSLENFVFEILEEVEPAKLKEKEQQFIQTLKPTYNSCNAKGLNVERRKQYEKQYNKEYSKSDKFKEYSNKYLNQLCFYNGEMLTLNALRMRFKSQGIDHPVIEAKKYLLQ